MAKTPAQLVADYLRREKHYNEEHRILPSECRIIDRLLRRDTAMREVCEELLAKLPHERQWQSVIGAVLSAAAFWSPDNAREVREAMRHVQKLNSEIADKAAKLAQLLEQRSSLAAAYSLHASDDYHPVCWLERAAECTGCGETSYRFDRWVRPNLRRLRGQFDRKYWPDLPDLLRAVASYAEESEAKPTDPLTDAAISSRKSSVHDFLRALLAGFSEQQDIPVEFSLSDGALATIANCALDLDGETCVGAEDVRNARRRDRNRNSG